jgi:F0F1-type ATP synthase membrane subunit b/b'
MISDIEKVYEDLINKAKNDSITEIQSIKEQKENDLKLTLEKKNEFVDSVLKNVSKEVNDDIEKFESNFSEAIKKIELNYQNNKDNLVELITKKLGYDF